MNRRVFLRHSGIAMLGVGSAPLWLRRALYAADAPALRRKILVAVFQRGAADGLNIVIPHGEKRYYDLRPGIAIPPPSRAAASGEAALDLDGFFGLHPALAPLHALWRQGRLGIVHACGSPDPTRSHFDAQDYMESGTPGRKATRDGWMNRALAPEESASPLRALAVGAALPRMLRGGRAAVSVQGLEAFTIEDERAAAAFERQYAGDAALGPAARDTFEAMCLLRAIREKPPAPGAYPRGRFGDGLRMVARVLKADVGLEMAFVDIGGWDHHVNEVGARAAEGPLANLLGDFGQALAAFWQDLGDRMENVVVVTMSEFGRTVRENGNRGTDHGHANCMFVMGGPVRGGKVYGRWPGLAPEQLYEGRDLALTTDFRAVLGELVASHLGNRDLRQVFPGYQGGPADFLGLLGERG